MNQHAQKQSSTAPLVSVVIPTCNRRSTLERCLNALACQTYPNFELIVVDDASTDDTPQFLERFVADHPDLRIQALRNESHAGANPSRNRGVRHAGGPFIAFEDSDCIAEVDWIQRLMDGFVSDRVAAVTGLVVDPPPGNIFELTFKGTHRLAKPGPAHRLIAGNMCVRREHLLDRRLDEDRADQPRHSDGTPDVSVSGRGDEEGLFLSLRAAGWEVRAVPDAVVLHEHHYTGRSLMRQAFRGGRSAARLVYKYYLPTRLDLLPFMLAYVTLPLILLGSWFILFPGVFVVGAVGALTYNDIFRKGKTVVETILSFPVLLVYYHVRLVGYLLEAVSLRAGRQRIKRQRLNAKI